MEACWRRHLTVVHGKSILFLLFLLANFHFSTRLFLRKFKRLILILASRHAERGTLFPLQNVLQIAIPQYTPKAMLQGPLLLETQKADSERKSSRVQPTCSSCSARYESCLCILRAVVCRHLRIQVICTLAFYRLSNPTGRRSRAEKVEAVIAEYNDSSCHLGA